MNDARKRLIGALKQQMEIQNANYPTEIPYISPQDLAQYSRDLFPAVIEHGLELPLLQTSDPVQELESTVGNVVANVAVTPTGLADAPLHNRLFVKPEYRQMTVSELIALLKENDPKKPVFYMQSQDDNLNKEFEALLEQKALPRSIPFAPEAWGTTPDAANLWIGNARTTSRLHCDNFENLYIQLVGTKEIWLIPPGDTYALDEKFLTPATCHQNPDGAFCIKIDNTDITIDATTTNPSETTLPSESELANAGPKLMFPTVDPSDPSTHNSTFTNYSTRYCVTLRPGQMLYIPALWYHQVHILDDADVNLSANYWYPPPSERNPLWTMWDFTRRCGAIAHGYDDADYFNEEE